MKFLFRSILILSLMAGCKRPVRTPATVIHPSDSHYSENNHGSAQKITSISRSNGPNQVKMKPMGGVYEIPTKINGVNMDFIFDTGASNISISETEVLFLIKQGKLTKDDVLGSTEFSDATGNVSEGTIINLRTVQIGNRLIKNVEASVVHNSTAPLLLGQSALAQFGKVTIDYKNNILSFE